MADIPSNEPAIIRAGDTITWRRSIASYPASAGWMLKYRLLNEHGKIDIAAAADGDGYLVTVSAATSAAWVAGTYTWHAYVERTGERHTVGTGTLQVKPNLAAAAAGIDARSSARKALDDTRAALATWIATNGHVQEYEIAGRRMRYASLAEIEGRIRLLEREVAREEAAERLAAGMGTSRKVWVRF